MPHTASFENFRCTHEQFCAALKANDVVFLKSFKSFVEYQQHKIGDFPCKISADEEGVLHIEKASEVDAKGKEIFLKYLSSLAFLEEGDSSFASDAGMLSQHSLDAWSLDFSKDQAKASHTPSEKLSSDPLSSEGVQFQERPIAPSLKEERGLELLNDPKLYFNPEKMGEVLRQIEKERQEKPEVLPFKSPVEEMQNQPLNLELEIGEAMAPPPLPSRRNKPLPPSDLSSEGVQFQERPISPSPKEERDLELLNDPKSKLYHNKEKMNEVLMQIQKEMQEKAEVFPFKSAAEEMQNQPLNLELAIDESIAPPPPPPRRNKPSPLLRKNAPSPPSVLRTPPALPPRDGIFSRDPRAFEDYPPPPTEDPPSLPRGSAYQLPMNIVAPVAFNREEPKFNNLPSSESKDVWDMDFLVANQHKLSDKAKSSAIKSNVDVPTDTLIGIENSEEFMKREAEDKTKPSVIKSDVDMPMDTLIGIENAEELINREAEDEAKPSAIKSNVDVPTDALIEIENSEEFIRNEADQIQKEAISYFTLNEEFSLEDSMDVSAASIESEYFESSQRLIVEGGFPPKSRQAVLSVIDFLRSHCEPGKDIASSIQNGAIEVKLKEKKHRTHMNMAWYQLMHHRKDISTSSRYKTLQILKALCERVQLNISGSFSVHRLHAIKDCVSVDDQGKIHITSDQKALLKMDQILRFLFDQKFSIEFVAEDASNLVSIQESEGSIDDSDVAISENLALSTFVRVIRFDSNRKAVQTNMIACGRDNKPNKKDRASFLDEIKSTLLAVHMTQSSFEKSFSERVVKVGYPFDENGETDSSSIILDLKTTRQNRFLKLLGRLRKKASDTVVSKDNMVELLRYRIFNYHDKEKGVLYPLSIKASLDDGFIGSPVSKLLKFKQQPDPDDPENSSIYVFDGFRKDVLSVEDMNSISGFCEV